MSLTGISQIRNHLYRLDTGLGIVRDHEIFLTSDEYTNLPHGRIVKSSETVKALIDNVPSSVSVMVDQEPASLPHQKLAVDSVVCAADSSLSCIYRENVDYIVDYAAGTVTRIDDGDIPQGATVMVFYLYYHVYLGQVDYVIDYQRGRIKRLAGGDIEEGQKLLIDYQPGSSEFGDDEIEQCITEAESEIKHIIDPSYGESTDPALQTSATCLTLSLLCRNAAGTVSSGLSGDRTVSDWLDLARSYRDTAMRLLTWFARDRSDLKPPCLA